MRKTKDWEWTLPPNGNGKYSFEQAGVSVLMDIRDELKRLNSLLYCQNFIEMPHLLRSIKKNTTKRRAKKKVHLR